MSRAATSLSPTDRAAFARAFDLLDEPPWEPYPWQVCPSPVAVQGVFLIEGGRGIGKTDGCAHYMLDHVAGAPCDPRVPGGHRMAIVAPTLDDAAESCVNGPSGLRSYNPAVVLRTALGGSKAVWPNGAEAKLFSGASEKDADRLRAGGNRCLVWIEEAAAIPWLDVAVKQARYGLRVGRNAHMVASSTPRPTPAYKKLRDDPTTVRTHGTTDLAHHLDPAVRQRLYDDYAGTRLGRQELLGELLEDVEGALWSLARIDQLRVAEAPALTRIVVAVDPSGGDSDDHDEQGIVVAGQSVDGDFYVLADRSCRETPHGWAGRAVAAYNEFEADVIVAEANYGGAMVESTIRQVGPGVPVRVVTASRGKRQRAEPVSALYEQGRVHHVGPFPQLEDQMCGWVPESGRSPDRMDALVWAVTLLSQPARRGPRMRFRAA
jgi:phage terminase large subunit-like protein